jgi:hypothetical protein
VQEFLNEPHRRAAQRRKRRDDMGVLTFADKIEHRSVVEPAFSLEPRDARARRSMIVLAPPARLAPSVFRDRGKDPPNVPAAFRASSFK